MIASKSDAMIGSADADHVALIRNHVIELVLSKKTGERGIAFVFFFARLDRDGQVIFAGETEAHHNMRNCLAGPIYRDNVGGVELAKIIGPSFPPRGKIGLRSIIEVSYVVDSDQVVLDGGVRNHGDLRLPVAIIGSRYLEVKNEQDQKDREDNRSRAAALSEKQKGESRRGDESTGGPGAPTSGQQRGIIERAGAPQRGRGDDHRQSYLSNPPRHRLILSI
jgi:hypothetical protein